MAGQRGVKARFAWLALPLVAAIVGCAANRAGDAASAGLAEGPWDVVAFEANSWGRPLHSWRVTQAGEGVWIEATGAGRTATGVEHHTLAVGAEGYAKLAALIEAVPVPAPSYERCGTFMTDQPYGTLRLTRGGTTVELAYNLGCREGEYGRYIAALQAADTLVGEWGRAAPVSHREAVR